ncbi:AAA family ATPase [Nocardia arthritidis]|uniref:AAA family ATPase n=1 Tax=Nocardia arthritidis TaxID=228602 RepID=UPI0007A4C524|nr:AAA family ATPase [Nocardia arthritidis]
MGADEHEQPRTAAALRARLRHIYWIGGGSGAGKSTIAGNLAARHGLRVYSTDDAMRDHAARSPQEKSPWLSRFAAMSMDERWVDRTPETMLDTFHWYRGEGFHFIVDDLLCSSAETGVIAEGFRLLPHLVAPLLTERSHGVWLLPSPAFRRAAFDKRGWEIPAKTRDPERAARNLLERDRLFTNRLRTESTRIGLPVIDVDAVSEEDLTNRVGQVLGL